MPPLHTTVTLLFIFVPLNTQTSEFIVIVASDVRIMEG